MREHDLRGLLAAACARVRGARALLVRPRACRTGECITLLREAQGYLEWLRDSLPAAGQQAAASPGRELRIQAMALATEIRQTSLLLDSAARAGRRWLERLQSGSGYTAGGVLPPLEARGQVSFLG